MGYCMELVSSEVTIRKENFQPLLEEVCPKLWEIGDLEHYLDLNLLKEAEETSDILLFFQVWKWEAILSKEGDICRLEFKGSKSGEEDRLFRLISPFVESRSYIEMVGEDGEQWRWFWKDRQLYEDYIIVSWSSDNFLFGEGKNSL